METKAFFDERTSTVTYVVYDPSTKDAVVIDPVLDYEPIGSFTFTESIDEVSDFIRDRGLKLHASLETHAHADHLSGSQILRRRFESDVAIGARIVEVQERFRGLFNLVHLEADGRQFDRLLGDGEVLEAGSLKVETIFTPGHTPACVTYRIDDALFTGDLLFMDDYGTGRCDFPGGDAKAMYASVQRLYAFPDETRVLVGHDYQPDGREPKWETTIGASKANNPQLSAETREQEFVSMREARDSTLRAPVLLYPSVQVNVDGGRMPPAEENGFRYLSVPINQSRPADELGVPVSRSAK